MFTYIQSSLKLYRLTCCGGLLTLSKLLLLYIVIVLCSKIIKKMMITMRDINWNERDGDGDSNEMEANSITSRFF